MKSGAIAVDQHLLYLLKGKSDSKATKSHAQIQVAKIREVHAQPGSQSGKPAKVAISYMDDFQEQKKELVFPKGDNADYKTFVNYLRSKEIKVKEVRPTATQAAIMPATGTIKWKYAWLPMAALVMGLGVVCIFFKLYIITALAFMWGGVFVYQFFKE